MEFVYLNIYTICISLVTIYFLMNFLKRSINTAPGPWGLPLLGCLPYFTISSKRIAVVFKEWSTKYGAVFSVKLGAVNAVILNDFESIRDAFVKPEFQDRIRMDVTLDVPGDGIGSASGRAWQEQRKFAHSLFRNFGIGKAIFEDAIITEVNCLLDELLSHKGEPIYPQHAISNAIANIICSVAYGQRFAYNDPNFQKVLKMINENMGKSSIMMALSVFLPIMKYLPIGGTSQMRKNMKTFKDFHDGQAASHKKKFDSQNINDFMDAYLHEIEKRKKNGEHSDDVFNDANMLYTIGDLFVAGTDTTSSTLLWVFLYLLNNSKVEEKAKQQIDEVVGRNRLPRYSDRSNLPYIEAIISESLRLGTLAGLSVPHVASRDSTVHGYHIPKGTLFLPNLHACFTDERYWKDPDTFCPERFIDKDGIFINREEFIPFGIGRRNCIGEQLAKMEMFIFVTHILHRTTITVPEGKEDPPIKGNDGLVRKPDMYQICVRKYED